MIHSQTPSLALAPHLDTDRIVAAAAAVERRQLLHRLGRGRPARERDDARAGAGGAREPAAPRRPRRRSPRARHRRGDRRRRRPSTPTTRPPPPPRGTAAARAAAARATPSRRRRRRRRAHAAARARPTRRRAARRGAQGRASSGCARWLHRRSLRTSPGHRSTTLTASRGASSMTARAKPHTSASAFLCAGASEGGSGGGGRGGGRAGGRAQHMTRRDHGCVGPARAIGWWMVEFGGGQISRNPAESSCELTLIKEWRLRPRPCPRPGSCYVFARRLYGSLARSHLEF